MDDSDLRSKLSEEQCLLHRCIAAPDYYDRPVSEEKPVARRTSGYAGTAETGWNRSFTRDAQPFRRRPGGNDQCVGLDDRRDLFRILTLLAVEDEGSF